MKTFFVSSTFKDMHNERDLMHKSIIPDLNEDAFQYGESVAIRDLRWGVNTAEEKTVLEANKKVLNVSAYNAFRSWMRFLTLLKTSSSV